MTSLFYESILAEIDNIAFQISKLLNWNNTNTNNNTNNNTTNRSQTNHHQNLIQNISNLSNNVNKYKNLKYDPQRIKRNISNANKLDDEQLLISYHSFHYLSWSLLSILVIIFSIKMVNTKKKVVSEE
jgi:hypothetical protein